MQGLRLRKEAAEVAKMLQQLQRFEERRPPKPKKVEIVDKDYVDKSTAEEAFKVATILWPEEVRKWVKCIKERREIIHRIYNLVSTIALFSKNGDQAQGHEQVGHHYGK